MSKLTAKQKKAYLVTKGVCCPFCLCHDIEGEITHNDYDGSYRQRVTCHACGRVWVDVYTLTAVEELEET